MKPTCTTYFNGTKQWFLNGLRHREDGPAVEGADGRKEWYLNGELHREDGPAVEGANGHKEWWLNGKLYTENEYWKEIARRNIGKWWLE